MTALPDIEFLFRLADAADRETLPRFRQRSAVDNKLSAAFDPVTEADREAERVVRDMIQAAFPDHAILGEEHGLSGQGAYRWVIDPIDGTRAFITGIPVWGTLIGLVAEGRARLGIMSQPFTRERFWADGKAAYGSGPVGTNRIAVSGVRRLGEATLFTTSPRLFATDRLRGGFEALEAEARLTRFGTDCYAFAMLAAGHVDLVVEAGLQPYDIVALIPIIEQAGGIVTTFDGGRPEDGGNIVAAASRELHTAALHVLNGG